MPEPSTASAGLQSGEVDWWEQPYPDLLPILRSNSKLTVSLKDEGGSVPVLRFNCIQPPFNNPTIRRIVQRAIDRSDVMRAVAGDDRSMWNDNIGIFTPGTPMATDVGLRQFEGPRDLKAARQALQEAGYKGERVVTLSSTDIPANSLSSEVVADILKQIGMNVDMQIMDYGTLVQRRSSRQPVANGGWSAFITRFDGATLLNPAVALITRGNGTNAWFGWPESPHLEELYEAWLRAEALPQKQAICRDIQAQMWEDATAFPLGQILLPTAYSNSLQGILEGFPKFYNVETS